MAHEFCTRLSAKIRRLGYAPSRANVILMFLIRCMALVCAVMGVLFVPGRAAWESSGQQKDPAPESSDPIVPAASGEHRTPLF